LNAAGKERAQFRKDPRWRQLNADVNAIRRRLDRVAEIEANNAEVAQRKAEKQAAAG
jgi:tetrahydromethanopterin S-methyltransferase subunit G